MKINLLSALLLLAANTALAATVFSEHAATTYYETIKNDPQQLLVFLQNMPKGADLHTHSAGATMAENMIRYATDQHLCIDRATMTVAVNAQCTPENSLDNAATNPVLYNGLIDAWSMRNFVPTKESGHDHFFASFGKFFAATQGHDGEILAEITDRAGQQNELYIELMTTPEQANALGQKVGWDADLSALRQKLLAAGLSNLVKKVSQDLDNSEAKQQQILACSSSAPAAGCQVKVRYLFQILREAPPAEVFAQLLTGFEAATTDKRIVGINMVQPEDGYISMRDYKLHMQMVGFLHKLYPHVHISLHAGELNSSLVPTDGLRFHIRDAVNVASAERIGHGVDIAYEKNSDELLRSMAKKHIMVEINLTSNAAILGVEGNNHPLPLYMRYQVPVALSTDDEGVLRTDLTEQYQRAILTYHFSYPVIKTLVRNSITYSFLPGQSLWLDAEYKKMNSACTKNGKTCKAFLANNEKAKMQWELEQRFKKFENQFLVFRRMNFDKS